MKAAALLNHFYKFLLYLPGGEKRMISHLKRGGVNIGKNIKIYGASSVVIDETRPWLLTIGDNVSITHGAQILTHDYSKSVLNTKYGENIGEGGETVIGNNVFIGMNSVILMGTHIGNNVIVGAGSVVRGCIPNDVVIAGNPARIICTLEEHLLRRREKTSNEALLVARSYIRQYGHNPSEHDMRHFKELFGGDSKSDKTWDSFEEFLKEADSK